ncbi:hypothetical protein FisN_6Lh053 [Fistulifera solaris]|uniref:Sirohydrochlorin cobaltochelatase n=1 Tax=Fistulifera solaris TaxID=1519565 RepID=A0A1Z5KP75_FISSO|nr:hypothetical protein FisN_6Lh053 [Fistulifera solaris]|eukprot:GAX28130.1 hypothetical protein FisN_6Lh053 [Fistulifera solaris]
MKYTSLLVALAALCGTNAFVGSLRIIPAVREASSSPFLVSPLHSNNNADDDLLFDPLLSPHAYPNGVDAGPVTAKPPSKNSNNAPNKRKPFGFRTNGQDIEPANNSLHFNNNNNNNNNNNPSAFQPNVFDPTISPHRYPNGTPNQVVDLSVPSAPPTHRIGILLMDHGSRNPQSNQRLHDLAQLYQRRLASTTTIVRAAHMEIAEPSIPQVLRQFVLEDQVDQIICHPYFLSPGRHVTQDIPQIVQQAVQELRQQVTDELPPIVTTDPVGAQTDVMLAAIHNLVQQSVTVPLTRRLE